MTAAVLIEPHPDDFVISMGPAAAHYVAAGVDVHVISMTRGGNGGPTGHFSGSQVCGWHGLTHHPIVEGYTVPTEAELGAMRIAESAAAVKAIGTVLPNPGVPAAGKVHHHEGGLPDGFAGTGSTPTAQGIADAKAVIESYVFGENQITNAFFHTMSPTDDHRDHAACGIALRQLKTENPSLLGGSRFFVSPKYWGPPRPADVEAENPDWFGNTISNYTELKPKYDAVVKLASSCYGAWIPPHSLGVGWHQVAGQFNKLAALWHD